MLLNVGWDQCCAGLGKAQMTGFAVHIMLNKGMLDREWGKGNIAICFSLLHSNQA